MKLGIILGLLFIGFGTWVVSGHAVYTTKRDVLSVGNVKASIAEEQALPPWTGYSSIAAGVVLLLAAAGRRRD